MEHSVSWIQSFIAELRRRRVIRALIAYSAAVFGLLQVADPVFSGLMLPDIAFRTVVIASIVGFPVVAALAWIYELTAEGLRKTTEFGATGPTGRVPLSRYLQAIGVFTVVVLLIVFTAGAFGRIRYPVSDDGRVGLAVFPFRTVAGAGEEWSEGAADLVSTALDATPSLRIVDPWSLWRPLRSAPDGPARPPEVAEAMRLTAEALAHRFLLASVTPVGDQVEVTFRLYQIGRQEPLDAYTVSAGRADLAAVARQAALRTLARLWGSRRPADVPAELDFDATQSPEALKAYLAAKEAMRQGRIDSANVAIDRALEQDSTFVLAVVEAVTIKSWGLSIRGQPYEGFFELLGRDLQESDLNERTRLRLRATRASVATDGRTAIPAARRILEIDPTDFGATAALAYYERAYGWQLDVPAIDERRFAEAVVQLDSTNLPALASRAWVAVAFGDTADIRTQLNRIERADTSGTLGRNEVSALRAVLAADRVFAVDLPQLAAQSPTGRTTTSRYLRVADPRRHAAFINALAQVDDPAATGLSVGEGLRLDLARGFAGRVDSAIAQGAYDRNDFYRTAQLYLAAAGLAGMGDPVATSHAIDELASWVPPDSVLVYFDTRPAWWVGWLVGAWHAQAGDTTLARRWIRAIGTLPPGGTSEDYVGSLQSDVEARLAARRGDDASALEYARRAFALWTIHTDNVGEGQPEPAMRLHLAVQYGAAGQPDSARALLHSLVPPATWMGFLTARARFELGELEAERGDPSAAAYHYRRALAFWEAGGPAAVPWADRVRERLSALLAG